MGQRSKENFPPSDALFIFFLIFYQGLFSPLLPSPSTFTASPSRSLFSLRFFLSFPLPATFFSFSLPAFFRPLVPFVFRSFFSTLSLPPPLAPFSHFSFLFSGFDFFIELVILLSYFCLIKRPNVGGAQKSQAQPHFLNLQSKVKVATL